MFKTTILKVALWLIVAIVVTSAALLLRENTNLRKQNKELVSVNKDLTDNLAAALKIKNYSISLAPSINNKVTSAFGSTKNVTFQYFFKMDGNTLEVKPDSVLYVQKLE